MEKKMHFGTKLLATIALASVPGIAATAAPSTAASAIHGQGSMQLAATQIQLASSASGAETRPEENTPEWQETERQYKDWEETIEEAGEDFQDAAAEASDETRNAAAEAWQNLQESWAEVEAATEENWEEAKAAFDESVERMEAAWDELTADNS